MLQSPDELLMWTATTKIQCNSTWIPPPVRMLKWNMDGSSNDKLESFSIGGFLRDHEGNLLFVFFCSSCIKESNVTEVLTI